jgi:hypothetical protein
VNPPAFKEIDIQTNKLLLPGELTNIYLNRGCQQQLYAVAVYTDGSRALINDLVSWNVTDNSIAKINSGGLLTGLKLGQTSVNASYSGVTGSSPAYIGLLFSCP